LYPQIAERDKREQCTTEFLEYLKQNAAQFATWASLPLNDLASNSKRKPAGQVRSPGWNICPASGTSSIVPTACKSFS